MTFIIPFYHKHVIGIMIATKTNPAAKSFYMAFFSIILKRVSSDFVFKVRKSKVQLIFT